MTGPLVEVVDWSPDWAVRFAADAAELVPVLPTDATVEHIGSTSVPGLPAKPIIDLLVTTADPASVLADGSGVFSLGYTYNPKYFADDPDHIFFKRDTGGVRTEHLHVFHVRSPAPQADRDFRDYLIAHPEAARRYAEAKRAAAIAHPDSRADYGTAKETVVLALTREARRWAADRRSRGADPRT